MTSSFTLPGGVKALKFKALFRAEPNLSHPNRNTTGWKTVPTQWVYLPDPSTPNAVAPPPPTKPADYVGQIVAVVVPS